MDRRTKAALTWPVIFGAGMPVSDIYPFPNDIAKKLYSIYSYWTEWLLTFWVISFVIVIVSQDISLGDRCQAIYATVNCSQSVLMCKYLRWKNKDFAVVLDLCTAGYKDDREPEQLIQQRKYWTRKAKQVTNILVFSQALPGCFWVLLAAVPQIQVLHGGRFFAVESWFPFDPFISPVFEFLLGLQALAGMYAAIKVAGLYDLLLNLGYSLVAMHSHLRRLLLLALTEGSPAALNLWISHHQHTIRIERLYQKVCSPALLMHFFFQMVIICTAVFVLVKGELDNYQTITASAYILAEPLKLFSICRMGDHISWESDKLSEEAFGTEWYLCPKEVTSNLKVILCRTRNKLQVTAYGVYPLSSETFRSVITSAYSFFTVLDKLK